MYTNINKKIRSDRKKMKRRANRKLKGKYLREHIIFDHPLVEESNTKNLSWEKEIDCLKLELQLLKDAFEKEKKMHENCIMFKEQCLKAEFPKLKKESKEALPSGNKFFRKDNDVDELQSPGVVKEEYVEYNENDTVKSEPIDQSTIKNEPIVAFTKSK